MSDLEKLDENLVSCEILSVRLADQIEAYCTSTGDAFDKLVVIPRGSFFVANYVARRLGFKAPDILSASITTYEETERLGSFAVGQMPQREDVEGKDLLVVDEVSDTGHTYAYLESYAKDLGARTVKLGVLHYKPEKNQTGKEPDFYVVKTNAWINYPWESHEAVGKTSVARRDPNDAPAFQ